MTETGQAGAKRSDRFQFSVSTSCILSSLAALSFSTPLIPRVSAILCLDRHGEDLRCECFECGFYSDAGIELGTRHCLKGEHSPVGLCIANGIAAGASSALHPARSSARLAKTREQLGSSTTIQLRPPTRLHIGSSFISNATGSCIFISYTHYCSHARQCLESCSYMPHHPNPAQTHNISH